VGDVLQHTNRGTDMIEIFVFTTMKTRTNNLFSRRGNFIKRGIVCGRTLGVLKQRNILSHTTKSL